MSDRIGILGGSFDPIHNGHIQSAAEIAEKFNLQKVFMVPAHQNPLKQNHTEASAEQRLKMLNLASEGYEDLIAIDDIEVSRGGKSYTLDTLDYFYQKYPQADFTLILGIDAFDRFDEWKSYAEILQKVNLVVTSRPGVPLPREVLDLPKGLHEYVALYDPNYIELTTGRNIQFATIKDVTISSTELRKRLRTGRDCNAFLALKVENYIRENSLYEPIGDKIGDSVLFLKFIGDQLDKRRAINMKAFDLTNLNASADFTIIASATSTRHARAIGEYLHQAIKDEFGVIPLSVEGLQEGRWVLLDFGAIIIHLFYDVVRGEYSIEELWSSGSDISTEVFVENN